RERKYNLLNNEMVNIRKKYMSKYGNREIHRAVVSGNERSELDNKDFYPMFRSEKVFPVLDKKANTSIYNAFVLLLISLLINTLTFIMLSNRKRLMNIFSRKHRG
ncbi:MAG: hypothetical protein KAS62_03615, partial [Candidatus Delongbacteria bacterium]|nr:hypothetical protein [Candidatus Delongbacteria bacterium]